MKISQYIADLLYFNDIVIVPGLGGFVTSYNPARIGDDQNTIYPPSKQIIFNPLLKNDDGLLVNYISGKEADTSFDAVKKVEEFREKVQYRLEKGEEIILEGLGILKLNEENKPVFIVDDGKNFLLDSYGLNMVQIREKPLEDPLSEKPLYEEKKKNKAWLLFLLIPVAALAVFIYLNIYNKNEIVPPRTNEPEIKNTNIREQLTEIDTAQTDSIVIDSSAVSGIKPEPVAAVPEDIVTTAEINYYLIGGNFSEQENADKYFSQISDLGYTPIHLGKQGTFYTVAIGGFKTFEEAKKVQNEFIGRDPESGVYIIRVNDD
ncbi:MAG: SPOR domain-containing protein [Prolixibacteraceae bacterium]|nr:SPOR domain-containing protein [Prolixibacteraceae bacterium]